MTHTLQFKWTVSRGRDTDGYNICSLYVEGKKVASCNGGGYDMEGTCLGSWVARRFAERLCKLKEKDMPAQSHWEADRSAFICRDPECLSKHIQNDTDPVTLHSDDWDKNWPTCPECGSLMSRDAHAGQRIDDGHYFYGLRFVDPKYDPRNCVLEQPDGLFTKEEDVGKTFGQLQKEGKVVDLDILRAAYRETSPVPTNRHIYPVIDGACGVGSVKQIASAIGLEFEYLPTRGKNNSMWLCHDSKGEKP